MKHRQKPCRPKPELTPKYSILIVTEDEKAEPFYFEALKRHLSLSTLLVDVKVEGKRSGSAPVSVVNCAIEMKRERQEDIRRSTMYEPYKEIWCVFDVEAPIQHTSLEAAIPLAINNKFHIAMTNPCFEFWLLLHYQETAKVFESNEKLIRELKKVLPAYTKKNIKPEIFDTLLEQNGIDKAIKHAKSALKSRCCEGVVDLSAHNSSTNVHLLVQKLQKLSQ